MSKRIKEVYNKDIIVISTKDSINSFKKNE